MVKNTPPINVTGIFTLASPFETEEGAIYRCEAIRGFNTLELQGIDVLNAFYIPAGLTLTDYETDKLNDVDIITLMSDNAETIHVPCTYITAYPLTETVPYSHMFLSVSLGVLPDDVILTGAMEAIEESVSEIVGTTAGVKIMKNSISNGVSWSEHTMLESNRKALVTRRETNAAAIRRMGNENASLRQRNDELMAVIVAMKAEIDALTP